MESSDAQLVEACRRNDKKAYRELYERFAPKMFGICLRYTHDNDAAKDVMHDGFMKVFANIGKLRSGDALVSWMASIMVRTALNALRREKMIADIPDDESLPDDYIDLNAGIDAVDVEYLMAAVRSLPPRYRAVFNMCEIDGLSFEEVSRELGIEQVTVRSNLLRARRILADKLKEMNE